MRNAAEIIEGLGGATAVAQATGYEPNAVRQWKHRKRLPRKAWPDLIAAFPGVTMDVLLKAERAA